jgi:hypothetical protein
MSFSNHLLALPSIVMVLVASGCDPGYGYDPVDENGWPTERWSETIDGVRLESQKVWGLLPAYFLYSRLTIQNHSDAKVIVVGGRLEANGKSLEARDCDLEDRTVPKGKEKEVSLDWDLSHLSPEERRNLWPTITYVWTLRIGQQERVIRVPMKME